MAIPYNMDIYSVAGMLFPEHRNIFSDSRMGIIARKKAIWLYDSDHVNHKAPFSKQKVNIEARTRAFLF